MYRTQGVLVLLLVLIGLAHSFLWDIVNGEGNQLKFYYNRKLINTEELPANTDVSAITYDPVHCRVLFANFNKNRTISSFDISTRRIQPILTRDTNQYLRNMAYDPVTQLIFWSEDDKIYSFSLKLGSSNKAVDGNLIVTSDKYCHDIAVDRCGGFIYWITDYKIERAAFDGSEREVLINSGFVHRQSLAIDQQTHKMYWIEVNNENTGLFIKSANWNGKNRETLYFIENEYGASSLVISKDFLYWKSHEQRAILQLLKNPSHDAEPKLYSNVSIHFWDCQLIAANYKIEEQIQGTKNCENLKSLIPNSSDVSVHGTNFSGASRSECTQDCTDEECNVSSCQNYCLQGNCCVNAEGQPKCSCKAGFSGERCEINACHKHCLYNGVCSLNEEGEPVCECTADYEGVRCDVPTKHTGVHADNTTPQVQRDLYNALKQVIKEELKHSLQFYSDKIDENEAEIRKCRNSITDIQNHICT